MENRFKKIRELGSKGKKCNPLLLEEFQWENEWVDENYEPVHEGDGNALTWSQVDEAIGATQGLHGRNLPRAAAARATASVKHTYVRSRKRPRKTMAQDIDEDDSDSQDQHGDSDSAAPMEEDEESTHTDDGSAPTGDGHGGFHLNDDLLN